MLCQVLLLPLTILVSVVLPIIQQIFTTVCNWVSSIITTVKTVVSQICKSLPWPLDKLCDLVTKVITLVETVWNFVCNTVITFIITVLTWLINLVIYVTRVICIIINLIIGLPGLLLCLLGLSPKRRIKVCIKVLTDEKDSSQVTSVALENSIATMREVYRQCNIEVQIEGIERLIKPEYLTGTDDSFGGLFTLWHSWFSQKACFCCNEVTVFFVDKISGTSNGLTYWGDNWCRVDAGAITDSTIMAHEVGHLTGLWHDDSNADLMFPNSGPATGNPRNTLTKSQCCIMRMSPFVTA